MHTHITRAHLKGYRNIQDTEATFREGLNIIIGPNGCGKTNFLWLLANIDSEEVNRIKINGDFEGKTENVKDLKIKILHKRDENNNIVKESLAKINEVSTNGNMLLQIMLSRLLLSYNIPTEIECFSLGNTILLEQGEINRNIYYLPITKNLVLRYLLTSKFRNYIPTNPSELNFEQKTIDILKKYTPIQDIRVEFPQREDEIKQINEDEIRISNLMYGFKINGEWFKWNELSDGTRRIVWLVLNILTTDSKVILIEEPELGIHPHQLAKLMDFIKDESENKQIIITTHSPEVLDILENHELDRIKLARYDEERGTTVIEAIAPEKMPLIQKYINKTGLLSGFWSRIGGLENIKPE